MASVSQIQSSYTWQLHPEYIQNTPNRKFKNDYIMKEELGKGGFGTVIWCVTIDGRKELAAKINNSPDKKASMLMEADFSRDLSFDANNPTVRPHMNLVNIFDSITEGDIVYNLYEMASGGDLMEAINENEFFTAVDAAIAIKQILDGVHFMHERGILHRDLKPHNILVQGRDIQVYKVTDFGLCCKREPNGQGQFIAKAHGNAGTPQYQPPECHIPPNEYDTDFDIWSCGCILYQMLAGYPPFFDSDAAKLQASIRDVDFPYPSPEWENMADAKDMIDKMLAPIENFDQIDHTGARVYPKARYNRQTYAQLITDKFYTDGAAKHIRT
ncbi:unnamed protein product, partial [Medioppia subpectinata]